MGNYKFSGEIVNGSSDIRLNNNRINIIRLFKCGDLELKDIGQIKNRMMSFIGELAGINWSCLTRDLIRHLVNNLLIHSERPIGRWLVKFSTVNSNTFIQSNIVLRSKTIKNSKHNIIIFNIRNDCSDFCNVSYVSWRVCS